MKIGINAIPLVPGKMGGTETYVKNLIIHLQKVDESNEYTVFCRPSGTESIRIVRPNFRKVVVGPRRSPLTLPLRALIRLSEVLLAGGFYKWVIAKEHLDLVHFPFTIISPYSLSLPTVLTFWDMQQEFYPEFFSSNDLSTRSKFYRPSCNKADRIIAASQFTKKTLVDRYAIDPLKITVIYPGCGEEFQPGAYQQQMIQIRKKYGLFQEFLLYPAATWPHKNHLSLLRAMHILKRRGFRGELVLTGMAMQNHSFVLKTIRELELQDNVRVLGYVPDEDMPALFCAATLMVFPSLFEGFGIPVIEAMAVGCPVACSNVTSLPEIVGNAALMFDPREPDNIAETIWKIWNDDSLQETLRNRGLERAKLFSWETAALKTVGVYRDIRDHHYGAVGEWGEPA